jgi:molybdopterin converting factor small subunit
VASTGVPAIVHLPRSLIALFPGAPRRLEATGSTVAEVLDDLDRQVPGMRNRLLDAGPEIRAHINIYVAAERAGLTTAVPPGADVHIIPAVSGGCVLLVKADWQPPGERGRGTG